MAHFPSPSARNGSHKPSPLRNFSTISNSSSEEDASNNSESLPPSRTSTISSHASHDQHLPSTGQKRGISDTSPTKKSAIPDYQYLNRSGSPPRGHVAERPSLQTIPQGANIMGPPSDRASKASPFRGRGQDSPVPAHGEARSPSPETKKATQHSMALSRSDSRRAPTRESARNRNSDNQNASGAAVLDSSGFESLGKSSTGHLRTLSKFAEEGDADFKITSPDQEVAGLHGRRRLQRNMSAVKPRSGVGYGGRMWMDKQRQFLQAYEYLCHIGEAKEWIEDIIHKDIPPIVQLEEALRDGVTLAEVVQALHPERNFRIFRNPRLQFRHSDNIAIFFKFLAQVELPELFRFELVDLYEKKNIPKVIYCIHALSWLLFRKGIINFRIGNLVGKLEFEQHELETMQKDLDKAGITMPNFSGMSEKLGAEPEPEPEPVETEEERIDRELAGHEETLLDLQNQIRGALLRLRLGDTMQVFWQNENALIDFQSRVRGDFSRQISWYRLEMKRFAEKLQSVARGFIVRAREKRKESHWKSREQDVILLQSLVRARATRNETKTIKSRMQQHHHGVREFQAAIRGALRRWDFGEQWTESRDVEPTVVQLQTLIRGAMQRRHRQEERVETKHAETEVVNLQSAIRAFGERKKQRDIVRRAKNSEAILTKLQSHAKAQIARNKLRHDRSQLTSQSRSFARLQAAVRGSQERTRFQHQKAQLANHHGCALRLQSAIRGQALRNAFHTDVKALRGQVQSIKRFQARCRGFLTRVRTHGLRSSLNSHHLDIVELQALAKAMITRVDIGNILENLDADEEIVTDLQAAARGMIVRGRFAEKQRHFEENMKKVIKIQSFVRGRQQGEAYKSLTSGKNPPVSTVKNFVHLLNDSDFDFDEELESEKLQKALVQRVQAIEQTEQWIADLDAKIGLLAHTKIASDELARMRKHNLAQPVGSMNRNSSVRDSFNLKALNKNSRAKLERYQELFFMLQTQPQYLARLFRRARERGTPDSDYKKLESLTMSTFAFAQKQREEYFLLRLLSRSIREEIDGCSSLQDFVRGNFFFIRLFNAYTRAPRDRKYVRQVLGPMFATHFIENDQLDLESDPLQIHRSIINDEELRTGRRSNQVLDISRDEAIKDKKVRSVFISHLQDLRGVVEDYFVALEDAVLRMPYGARCVAQQIFNLLSAKFPRENPDHLVQIAGNWLWKTYFKPAVTDPESHGIVDRSLEPAQKKNLAEFSKVINQIAIGRLFGEENIYLQPLNSFVEEMIGRFRSLAHCVIEVPDVEAKFDINQFKDLYAKVKPTLYIKMADVFAVHQMVADELGSVCVSPDDNVLREIVRDLGSARNNESEMGAGSAEVTLHLSGKVHNLEDPDADIKALFMETKRCVLYIIRVQAGASLMNIMVKPITEEDEDRWESLVREELAVNSSNRKRTPYSDGTQNNLIDIASMSYSELKRIALENILSLERAGRLTRHNQYQDLLNEIAVDIRTKHRRRVQRQRELETVRNTISQLDEKQAWLDDRLKAYNDTFEQNVAVLQGKSAKGAGKSKFVMPFSKQWHHNREMERLGREPRYGSYKRAGEHFLQKGILLSWEGRDLRADDITISSDEINQFLIEGSSGSMIIMGASAEFTWDDLLEAEYEGKEVIEFFSQPEGSIVGGGPRKGVLRLDRAAFKAWMSKKFFPDA